MSADRETQAKTLEAAADLLEREQEPENLRIAAHLRAQAAELRKPEPDLFDRLAERWDDDGKAEVRASFAQELRGRFGPVVDVARMVAAASCSCIGPGWPCFSCRARSALTEAHADV